MSIFRILGSDEVVRNCFTLMTAITPFTTLNPFTYSFRFETVLKCKEIRNYLMVSKS